DLIETKPLCILALLDEECRFPNGSDESFVAKVRKTHQKDDFFAIPRLSSTAFTIKHYAGNVDYETSTGFLDKNKDFSVPAHPLIMQKAENPFLRTLFGAGASAKSDGGGGGLLSRAKAAVGTGGGAATSGTFLIPIFRNNIIIKIDMDIEN